jgi:hypothetical protein
VHLEVIADHLAGRRLVVDDDDVRVWVMVVSVCRHVTVNVDPCPGRRFRGHMAAMPCRCMRLDDRQAGGRVELSAAVGLAESRWNGEQPAEILRRKARALVGDADPVSSPSWLTVHGDLAADREYLMALLKC